MRIASCNVTYPYRFQQQLSVKLAKKIILLFLILIRYSDMIFEKELVICLIFSPTAGYPPRLRFSA